MGESPVQTAHCSDSSDVAALKQQHSDDVISDLNHQLGQQLKLSDDSNNFCSAPVSAQQLQSDEAPSTAVAGDIVRDLDLPVIDCDGALEQCCDWAFVTELLDDILNDRQVTVNDLQAAVDSNDHVKYYKTAHAIKGAALNLHLIALTDVSKTCEQLGKTLDKLTLAAAAGDRSNDTQLQQLLVQRQGYVHAMDVEYSRLEDFMPEARAAAAAEAEGVDGQEDDN